MPSYVVRVSKDDSSKRWMLFSQAVIELSDVLPADAFDCGQCVAAQLQQGPIETREYWYQMADN